MLEILKQCNIKHKVIRQKEEYNIGDDIDILCDNKEELAAQIVYLSKYKIKEGFTIELKENSGHTHIDFIKDNILNIRFDLITSLDCYKEVIYSENEYADIALRLLEFAYNPHKIQHLQYAKDKLKT